MNGDGPGARAPGPSCIRRSDFPRLGLLDGSFGLPPPVAVQSSAREPAHRADASCPAIPGQMGMTVELPVSTPELVEALHRDRRVARARRAALAALGALRRPARARAARAASSASGPTASMLDPGRVVALALRALRRAHGRADPPRARRCTTAGMPALLVTADVLALAALVWLSGSPAVASRLLLGALLVVQLAVFYFGWGLGTYAAVDLGASPTCSITLVLPPQVRGAGAGAGATSRSPSDVFALVSAVLISAYGSFRERMNRLRLFCKLVEDGDLHPVLDARGGQAARRPDAARAELRRDARRLAEQIGTDPLTGCLNRRALETRLRAEWRQAKRRGTTLAVLAIDLDHFKEINDTHGHPFGDLVLQRARRHHEGDGARHRRGRAARRRRVHRRAAGHRLGGRAHVRRADAPHAWTSIRSLRRRASMRITISVGVALRARHRSDVARAAAAGSRSVAVQGEERRPQPCLRLTRRRRRPTLITLGDLDGRRRAHRAGRGAHAAAAVRPRVRAARRAGSGSSRRCCSAAARSSSAARTTFSRSSTPRSARAASSRRRRATTRRRWRWRRRCSACRAVVVMPTTVTPAKRARRRAARRAHRARGDDDAGSVGSRRGARWSDEGLTMVPPYDHPWIIAGQGTVGLEIAEDLPDVGTVLVPVGGGGLSAGVGDGDQAARAERARHRRRAGGRAEADARARGGPAGAARVTRRTRRRTARRGGRRRCTFAHHAAYIDDVVHGGRRGARAARCACCSTA